MDSEMNIERPWDDRKEDSEDPIDPEDMKILEAVRQKLRWFQAFYHL